MRIAFLLALCISALAGAACAQSVALLGPAGQTATLTSADFTQGPRVKVTALDHGKTIVYEGVLLGGLLTRVGAAEGKAIRGAELATVVRVTASDGYQVVLGLAETDPGTRPNRVILADRADGAPLATDGPFRLVVEGDLRPARSARNVVRIEVLSLATRP